MSAISEMNNFSLCFLIFLIFGIIKSSVHLRSKCRTCKKNSNKEIPEKMMLARQEPSGGRSHLTMVHFPKRFPLGKLIFNLIVIFHPSTTPFVGKELVYSDMRIIRERWKGPARGKGTVEFFFITPLGANPRLFGKKGKTKWKKKLKKRR